MLPFHVRKLNYRETICLDHSLFRHIIKQSAKVESTAQEDDSGPYMSKYLGNVGMDKGTGR
jgi:hypothetical protein